MFVWRDVLWVWYSGPRRAFLPLVADGERGPLVGVALSIRGNIAAKVGVVVLVLLLRESQATDTCTLELPSMVEEDTNSLSKELNKLRSRNEELTKQDATLRREYTTLFRKISSLTTALRQMDKGLQELADSDKIPTISDDTLRIAPALDWYNRQIALIEEAEDFEIPQELEDAYRMYKNTPLLYRDAVDSDDN